MIHPTKEYDQLCKDVASAKKLLSKVKNDDVPSKEVDQLKAKAFVLLAHAALEAYIEDVSLEAAKHARKRFKKGAVCRSLIALVASCVSFEVREKTRKSVIEDLATDLDKFSDESVNWLTRLAHSNNGIRRENQKSLFLPIGVDPEKVDVTTYAALDAFGVMRGEYAHKFQVVSVQTTPREIKSKVEGLVFGLAEYDRAVCNALEKLRFIES